MTKQHKAQAPEKEQKLRKTTRKDVDNPPLTKAFFKKARPAREVLPEIVEAYTKTRGRPQGRKKTVVSLSLDAEIVTALRASGPGWQTRLNEFIKAASSLWS